MTSEGSDLWKLGSEAAREGYGFFIGNTASTAILAIGSIVIARLLGSDGYGLYSLSLVIPSFLVLFTSLGIDQSLIKYLSEYESKKLYHRIREIFKASLIFKIVLGSAATAVVYFSSDLLASIALNRPYLAPMLKLSSFLILSQTIYTLCSNLFIGLGRASLAGALATLQAVIKVSLIIALLALGFGVWGAVFGHVSGYAVAAVIGLAIGFLLTRIRSRNVLDDEGSAFTLIKPLISYGLPLYASTIILVTVSQYNNLVLANFASNIEIGSYAAAVNLSTITLLVMTPIATVLYPSFSKVEATNKEDLPRVFELALRYSVLSVAPTALFVSAFSRQLVNLIYGAGFHHAISYLALYAALYSIYPFISVGVSYFNGVGLPKKTLLVNLVRLVMVLPLSPLLAYFFNVIGVIMAFTAANLAAAAYAAFFLARKEKLQFGFNRIAKIYLGSVLSAIAAYAATSFLGDLASLLAGAALFLLFYASLIGLSRALDERDYVNLREILGRLRFVGRVTVAVVRYAEILDNSIRKIL